MEGLRFVIFREKRIEYQGEIKNHIKNQYYDCVLFSWIDGTENGNEVFDFSKEKYHLFKNDEDMRFFIDRVNK